MGRFPSKRGLLQRPLLSTSFFAPRSSAVATTRRYFPNHRILHSRPSTGPYSPHLPSLSSLSNHPRLFLIPLLISPCILTVTTINLQLRLESSVCFFDVFLCRALLVGCGGVSPDPETGFEGLAPWVENGGDVLLVSVNGGLAVDR